MATPGSPYTVTFNGFDLGSTNVLIGDIDYASTPDITANILPVAKAPRSSVTSALKQQKTITITGVIRSTTNSITDCMAQIRTYQGKLVGIENTLSINDGTTNSNYIATVNKNNVKRPNNLGHAQFVTTFLCSQPYATDSSATTLVTASGRTSASYSDSITVSGNTQWQMPIIQVTYSALTSGTNKSVTIGNSLVGQACTVTRTWASTDVLLINTGSLTLPVSVNGTAVVFTGALPTFNPTALVASQAITYTDSFATRTFAYLVTNFNQWES